MKINELKLYLRPIEKLINNGANSLSNAELLAILINTGIKDKNCIEIAIDILNSLESFSDLVNISFEELINFKGIKNKKAALIIAAFELYKRSINEHKNGILIKNELDVFNLLKNKIKGLNKEKLFVLYLNVKCQLIKLKTYDNGNISSIVLPINKIIEDSIKIKSSFIIISHNHPSNQNNPSKEDIKVTNKLNEILKIINVPLLDHIIICENSYYSMKINNNF